MKYCAMFSVHIYNCMCNTICKKIFSFRRNNIFVFMNITRYLFYKHSLNSYKDILYMPKKYSKQRNFNFSTCTNGNIFLENENIFAHEILESNNAYIQTVVPHPLKFLSMSNDYSCVTKDDSVYKFYQSSIFNLKTEHILDDQIYTNVILSLVNRIPFVNYEDIRLILFGLCLWPHNIIRHGQNFCFLWNSLDQECMKRLKDWSIDQKLLIADYWFHLRLGKFSNYNRNMTLNLINDHNELTQEQFVQLMFFIMLHKSYPQSAFDSLIPKFNSVVSLISIEEISIICLSYFKNDAKMINHNILKFIIDKTILEISRLESVTFIRIIKFLRKSFQDHLTHYYIPLVKACTIRLKEWDLFAAVHIALFCAKSFIFEPSLLDAIMQKLKDNISNSRMKDISKVIQCLSQFNYLSDSNFHDILFEEIMKPNRLKERNDFPEEILNIVLFYAYMEKYPFNIIKYILHPSYVKLCQNKRSNELIRRLAVIDYCIDIECKDYSGPRLNPAFLKILENKYVNFSDENDERRHINIISGINKKIINSIGSLLSPNDFTLHGTLPHSFNPDIIVRLKSNERIPLKAIINASKQGIILQPPTDELWGCLVVCGPFSFPYKSERLCGLISMKRRHLLKLGYKVALIPHKEFPFYEQKQKLYLQQKINSLLKNSEESYSKVNSIL